MPSGRGPVPGRVAVRVGVVEEVAGGHVLAEVLRQRSSAGGGQRLAARGGPLLVDQGQDLRPWPR